MRVHSRTAWVGEIHPALSGLFGSKVPSAWFGFWTRPFRLVTCIDPRSTTPTHENRQNMHSTFMKCLGLVLAFNVIWAIPGEEEMGRDQKPPRIHS